MTIPEWLKERLGIPTRGRGVRHTRCLVCNADVLAGFDEDACAKPAIVDPHPLSVIGELLALLEDRRTYRLDQHGQGMALWHRSHWQIKGSPASDTVLVLTDHRCGGSQFPGVEITKSRSLFAASGLSSDATPPF